MPYPLKPFVTGCFLKGETVMCKKTKGLIKFLLVLGAIAAAAVAVAAFVSKMQKRLCCKCDETEPEGDCDCCKGECDECDFCDGEDEADGETETVEATSEAEEAAEEGAKD